MTQGKLHNFTKSDGGFPGPGLFTWLGTTFRPKNKMMILIECHVCWCFLGRWLNQLVWLQHVHGKASCHIVYLWHHGTSVESSMKISGPIQHSPTIHQASVKIMEFWFVRPSVNPCGISPESIVPCRKSLFLHWNPADFIVSTSILIF